MQAPQATELVQSASGLVEAILTGIHRHLGEELNASCELRSFRPTGSGVQDFESLSVRFERFPIVGEIATRSRVAVSVQVDQELRFLLQAPTRGIGQHNPLVLRVEGLHLPALPEAVDIRRTLRATLGTDVTPQQAYGWWKENKDERYPLQDSKFHRVVESLLEQKGMKLLGEQVAAESFWGYVHTHDLDIALFKFMLDSRAPAPGIAVIAELGAPADEADRFDRRIVEEITKKMLREKRRSAEKLAPSGINVGAMIHGPGAGQPGATVKVVTKLLSAAEWWGCGKDSWHQFDETWDCTDKKDMLGRVTKQQGRIIWRTQDGPPKATPAKPSSQSRACGAGLNPSLIALFFLSSAIAMLLISRFADGFS
jgi:hypothetical protein